MVEYTSTGAEHYLELSDTPTEDSLAVNEAGSWSTTSSLS